MSFRSRPRALRQPKGGSAHQLGDGNQGGSAGRAAVVRRARGLSHRLERHSAVRASSTAWASTPTAARQGERPRVFRSASASSGLTLLRTAPIRTASSRTTRRAYRRIRGRPAYLRSEVERRGSRRLRIPASRERWGDLLVRSVTTSARGQARSTTRRSGWLARSGPGLYRKSIFARGVDVGEFTIEAFAHNLFDKRGLTDVGFRGCDVPERRGERLPPSAREPSA